MVAEPTESSPLMKTKTGQTRIKTDHIPEASQGAEDWKHGVLVFFQTIPLMVLQEHYIGLILALASAFICWKSGHAGDASIDPLCFKAVFLLFSLTLGFRNSIANQKRALALDKLHRMTGSFWAIYTSLPNQVRGEYKEPLLGALGALVDQLVKASEREILWFKAMGFAPVETYSDVTDERNLVTLSPRSLMNNTLLALEARLRELEGGPALTLVRSLWAQKTQLIESYDALFACTIPPVGKSYYIFTDVSLAVFAAALPWSMHDGEFFAMFTNTLILVWGVFAFEAVTRAYEDTLAPAFAGEALNLHHLRKLTEAGVEGFESALMQAQQRGVDNLIPKEHFDPDHLPPEADLRPDGEEKGICPMTIKRVDCLRKACGIEEYDVRALNSMRAEAIAEQSSKSASLPCIGRWTSGQNQSDAANMA